MNKDFIFTFNEGFMRLKFTVKPSYSLEILKLELL